jgi:8-oxo-dGTP pyrophosphatase MutT (NUDIX family)
VKPGKVRPIAICIFQKDDRILVAEGYDRVKQQRFYRPLGGTIEFGEPGDQTIIRELQEELGAKVTDARYLTTLENIFIYQGELGHEIVLVYTGNFADKSIYGTLQLEGREDDGKTFTAMWKSLTDFSDGQTPLYPTGLLALLTG